MSSAKLTLLKAEIVLTAVCALVCSQALLTQTANAESLTSAAIQQEYEWASAELYEYAQTTSFSLIAFTIPAHTQRAEFVVNVNISHFETSDISAVFSLRRHAIPVLRIEAYNESVPEAYTLPTDQTTHYMQHQQSMSVTLDSPTPGRVFLAASIVNPLDKVIHFLRWREGLNNQGTIHVKAVYTLRTAPISLTTDDVSSISIKKDEKQTYSFSVPAFTTEFSIILSNCSQNDSLNCPVTMTTADSLAEADNSSVSVDCRQQKQQCQVTVVSPLAEHDHYATFTLHDTGGIQNASFDIRFHLQGCSVEATHAYSFQGHAQKFSRKSLTSDTGRNQMRAVQHMQREMAGISEPVCASMGHFGRNFDVDSVQDFASDVQFVSWTIEGEVVPVTDAIAPDDKMVVRAFSIQSPADIGGILSIGVQLSDKDWHGLVWVCAMAHRLPTNGSVDRCVGGTVLNLNSTRADADTEVKDQTFLPFPASGTWYLALQSQCWKQGGPVPCELLPMVELTIRIAQCAPNKCGKYGSCDLFIENSIVFAGCSCNAGYRGLDCSDGTYSLTEYEQLRAVYLLTLSNLAFLPAICLALYRHHFTLAVIFSFTCFFSSFYHACDTSRVYQLCILNYNSLAFCDFFGSVLSFYAVLLTMARIPETFRTFSLMTGTLLIAVFQNSDRHSDLAHVLPLVVAGLIMVVSWIRIMWLRKKLFPSKRRYIHCLLPGVVLAISGIVVNYTLVSHLSTYQYSHSYWHVALMTSPCFLMPPRPKKQSGIGSKSGLSISAQDIITGDRESQQLPQTEEDEPAMFDASMNSINTDQKSLV